MHRPRVLWRAKLSGRSSGRTNWSPGISLDISSRSLSHELPLPPDCSTPPRWRRTQCFVTPRSSSTPGYTETRCIGDTSFSETLPGFEATLSAHLASWGSQEARGAPRNSIALDRTSSLPKACWISVALRPSSITSRSASDSAKGAARLWTYGRVRFRLVNVRDSSCHDHVHGTRLITGFQSCADFKDQPDKPKKPWW
jgi:hypothetical protein